MTDKKVTTAAVATDTTEKKETKKVERDVFGSRKGSICYRMNAVIINAAGVGEETGIDADTLAEKAEVTRQRAYNHLLWLRGRNCIDFDFPTEEIDVWVDPFTGEELSEEEAAAREEMTDDDWDIVEEDVDFVLDVWIDADTGEELSEEEAAEVTEIVE